MHKFEESGDPLSELRYLIVMADEAHRGWYGLTEIINLKPVRFIVHISYINAVRNYHDGGFHIPLNVSDEQSSFAITA